MLKCSYKWSWYAQKFYSIWRKKVHSSIFNTSSIYSILQAFSCSYHYLILWNFPKEKSVQITSWFADVSFYTSSGVFRWLLRSAEVWAASLPLTWVSLLRTHLSMGAMNKTVSSLWCRNLFSKGTTFSTVPLVTRKVGHGMGFLRRWAKNMVPFGQDAWAWPLSLGMDVTLGYLCGEQWLPLKANKCKQDHPHATDRRNTSSNFSALTAFPAWKDGEWSEELTPGKQHHTAPCAPWEKTMERERVQLKLNCPIKHFTTTHRLTFDSAVEPEQC